MQFWWLECDEYEEKFGEPVAGREGWHIERRVGRRNRIVDKSVVDYWWNGAEGVSYDLGGRILK